jgi:isopenicillin N synthase-like dioxygenase
VLARPVWLKHRCVSSVSKGSFSIPVVDFSGFRSSERKQDVATKIVSAFKESGFVYLSGHGIPSGL